MKIRTLNRLKALYGKIDSFLMAVNDGRLNDDALEEMGFMIELESVRDSIEQELENEGDKQ